MPSLQDIDKEFDEKFGIDGPDRNSDSIGRGAGCDDCSGNIEMRKEHKDFLHQALTNQREAMIKLIPAKKRTTNKWNNEVAFIEGFNECRSLIIQVLTQKE